MTDTSKHHRRQTKASPLKTLLSGMTGKAALLEEKARLEAFLTAFPGDYCGWSPDGSVIYSAGFCALLGLERIGSIHDIQNSLNVSDAAALEGVFNTLKETGRAFTLTVLTNDGTKALKISGTRGNSLDAKDHFITLWAEDVSESHFAQTAQDTQMSTLSAAHNTLDCVLKVIPWPIWKRDNKGALIWCNARYADFVGQDIEGVIREQKELPLASSKKKSEEGQPISGSELAAKARTENAPQISKAHIVYNGKRLLMRLTEMPHHDAQTGFTGSIGMAEDISELEELESAIKRFQATQEELLEQLRTAIGVFDSEHRLVFYNSAFSQLWALEDQWLNGKPRLGDLLEKLRESRRLPEQADFRKFKQGWINMFTSLLEPHEDMLYLPDGSALRMLVVPHSAGGLMMTFEDVTSRLELESSYNTLIAVQRETLDNLAEAVAVYGGNGRLKLWNPSFARLWRFNPEDLSGEPHINTLVDKKKSFFSDLEWPVRRDELIAKGLDRIMHEGRLKRSDDTLVDYSTVPLPDGGVLITYADVTDSVRVENALREKNAALEAAEKLKIDFLANVSYQLRTPLNAIMGFNDILDQQYFGPLNPRQKEYTGDIRAASNRLLNLINDILDLSTIEAGYMSLEREDTPILGLLESIVDLTSDWARKSKIEISLQCPKTIGKISIDARRLKQAIMNIIRNSITFTPSGGKISVAAKRLKDGVQIVISDTGIGISRENHRRIFEPFERAQRGFNPDQQTETDNGVTMRSGAGLGLSLVKNIMKLHGGSVTLQSELNEGTTVTLFIPFEAKSSVKPIKMGKALSFQ